MKRAILSHFILFAVMAIPVVGSETESRVDPRKTRNPSREKSVDALDELIPKREIKFQRSTQEYPMKLFRADPKLLQQSHVAIVRLLWPEVARGGREELPGDLRRLTFFQRYSLFDSILTSQGRGETSTEYFKRLTAKIPDKRLPPKKNVAFFAVQADDGYVQFERHHGPPGVVKDPNSSEFRILAPSAERAAELAKTLVQLFDYGLFAPIQLHIQRHIQAEKEKIQGSQSAIAKAEKELREYEKRLDASGEISRDELASLRNHRRLLSVDLAGVKARIDAAAKILAHRNRLGTSRIEQVENIKITAEIELAGLAARQKTLDEIIDSARRRIELRGKTLEAQTQMRVLKNRVKSSQSQITQYERMAKPYMPMQLHEGKVVIRPIKWTK